MVTLPKYSFQHISSGTQDTVLPIEANALQTRAVSIKPNGEISGEVGGGDEA